MKISDTKHIWLPAILTVYTIIMAYIGRDMLIVDGNYFQFFGIIIAEAIVIIALSVFLRKKYLLKRQREIAADTLQHSDTHN